MRVERSPVPAGEVWYRVVDGRYAAPVDDWENPVGPSTPFVRVLAYRVLRHTRKGVWLEGDLTPRLVMREGRKRWACPTEEEAWESFKARKQRQAMILRHRLDHVKQVLNMIPPEVK